MTDAVAPDEREVPEDERFSLSDAQSRGSTQAIVFVAVVGLGAVFGVGLPRWIGAVSDALEQRSTPLAWPIELACYVLVVEIPLAFVGIGVTVARYVRDRRLGTRYAGTLSGELIRAAAAGGANVLIQYLMALAVFGAARSPFGWAGAGWAAALVFLILRLGNGAFIRLVKPVYRDSTGSLEREVAEGCSQAGLGAVQTLLIRERGIGTRMNGVIASNRGKPELFVWDTMLDIPEDQRRMIIAHELGHVAHRDVAQLTAAACVVTGLASGLGMALVHHSAFFDLQDLSSLKIGDPRLYWSYRALSVLITLVLSLLMLQWRRRVEARADLYALDLQQDPGAFRRAVVTLIRANREPVNRSFRGAGCSHPPAPQRLAMADDWERRHSS